MDNTVSAEGWGLYIVTSMCLLEAGCEFCCLESSSLHTPFLLTWRNDTAFAMWLRPNTVKASQLFSIRMYSASSSHLWFAVCRSICLTKWTTRQQRMISFVFPFVWCKPRWPPLWPNGQSSWLQIRRPGFDSRHYQEKKVVSLERGPLSLVSITEELLDRKVAAPA
jgi:hypothetical protein